MITEDAHQFYFKSLNKQNLYLDGLVSAEKSPFTTLEHTRALHYEWNDLNLNKIMSVCTKISSSAYLEILIERESVYNHFYRKNITTNQFLLPKW